jgi:serine/threonine protein kinase/WD40 repeat protein
MKSRHTALRAASRDTWQPADLELEQLIEEVTARLQKGEPIDHARLAEEHPQQADQLRDLLPAIEVLAKLGETPMERSVMGGQSPPPPQQQLGDFRLIRELGRGGMGVVYEAEEISLGRRVALKVLPFAGMLDQQQLARFKNEARAAATLKHPHIVSVYSVGCERSVNYYAMELVEGQSLAQLIAGMRKEVRAGRGLPLASAPESFTANNGGRMRETEPVAALPTHRAGRALSGSLSTDFTYREYFRTVARLGIEAAGALDHAHQNGILHRDIKPANLLVDGSGKLWITDFGLARMEADAGMTMTGELLGTLRYMSPEQALAKRVVVDHRADIYSLGATLYELLTLRPPFEETDRTELLKRIAFDEPISPRQVDHRIPVELETIILKAMRKSPDQRYATAMELADDLKRFLDGRPIQARPISLGERALFWANRNRALTAAAAGSLGVLALVALVASALVLRANSQTSAALQESRENEAKAKQSAVAAATSERTTRELLYAADMALAGAAWRNNQPGQVRMVLDRYTQSKTATDGLIEDDLRGFEWYFLDRQTRPRSDLLFQTDKALYLIEFMPGGTEFFTAGEDSIVRWHDASTGKVLHSLDTQQTEINCVSYNPAGTLFATAGDDGTVKIWNAIDRTLLQSIKVTDLKCYYAKFINNEHVFTGGDTKSQQLFNATTGESVREYVSPDATAAGVVAPYSLAAYVSRSKDRVWVQARSGSTRFRGVYEWDIDTGKSRRIYNNIVTSVLADSTEQYLFVHSLDGFLRILDAKSGGDLWSTQVDVQTVALGIRTDEKRLAVGDRTGQVYLWNLDLSNPETIVTSDAPQKLSVHSRSVYGIEFTSDGDSMLTVGGDGAVRRTRLNARPETPREVTWLLGKVDCAAIPGSNLVITTTPLAVHDRLTGSLIRTLSTDPYQTLAVSSDGALAAAGSGSHVSVWNIATGKQMLRFEQQRRAVSCLDFSRDNSLLAVSSRDSTDNRVDVIEIATGGATRYTSPEESAKEAYFSANDGLVVIYGTPYQLQYWTIPDRDMRWRMHQTDTRIHKAMASPDRTQLLVNLGTRNFRLIECATGTVCYEAPDDYNPGSFAFVGDGRSFVVSNSRGGQLSLWHTATGRRLFEIANIETGVNSIQRLDNGFLVSARRVSDGHSEIAWFEF